MLLINTVKVGMKQRLRYVFLPRCHGNTAKCYVLKLVHDLSHKGDSVHKYLMAMHDDKIHEVGPKLTHLSHPRWGKTRTDFCGEVVIRFKCVCHIAASRSGRGVRLQNKARKN